MARSVVDNDQWFAIPITGGTLQNTGPVPVEISNAETNNTGIVLQPNEIYQWSDATIYARKAWGGVASGEITYVPFKKAAGGGGGSSYPTAAAHNSIYRGKDLTSYMESGDMSMAIAAGTFDDIFIGDYITKSVTLPAITYTNKAGTEVTQAEQTFTDVRWRVAGLDYFLNCGSTPTTTHHVVLIPDVALQRNVCMNPTDDATGGYFGTDMWKVHMPNWASAIKSAFGSSHVLKHKERSSDKVDTEGRADRWASKDAECNIPNESMICGSNVWSNAYDIGDCISILPLFLLRNHMIGADNTWCWVRAVYRNGRFSGCSTGGEITNAGASLSQPNGGIRPYFLYY